MRLRQWVTAAYVRLLCTLLGRALLELLEETYQRGYAAGRAAEHAALLADFAVLEHGAAPTLH